MAQISGFDRAASVLPPRLRERAMGLDARERDAAEEIRLRAGNMASVLLCEGERELDYTVSVRDLADVLESATGASAHSAMETIRRGFVTVRGGCRIGLAGVAVAGRDGIESIRHISSMNIRVPRDVRGCADGIWDALGGRKAPSTLIVSPPGGGKTTLLRELVRLLSDSGARVSLADERGEVAAVWEGLPQFDVGRRTDVLTGAPKAEGIMLLLRSMNPEIIALDEITAPEDIEAITQAANCGVRLLASAHARDMAELLSRPLYAALLREKIFRRVVRIEREGGARRPVAEELRL